MTNRSCSYPFLLTLLLCFLQTAGIAVYGQLPMRTDSLQTARTDTLTLPADTLTSMSKLPLGEPDAPLLVREHELHTDSLPPTPPLKVWVPNPVKATWLALVIPGGGQIYNRKYWKLPIFYGGFAGCAYALTWNNKMYQDYSQAYKDMASGNRYATSITDLLPPGYNISDSQLTDILRRRKDMYRRYRDLSIFAFIGVYLLSVIDAYVDAELSNFDITPDLSMHLEPILMNNQYMTGHANKSVGLQCSFRF